MRRRAEITAAASGPASVMYLPLDAPLWAAPILGAVVTFSIYVYLQEVQRRRLVVVSNELEANANGLGTVGCGEPRQLGYLETVMMFLFIMSRLLRVTRRGHFPRALPSTEAIVEPSCSGGPCTPWEGITHPMVFSGATSDRVVRRVKITEEKDLGVRRRTMKTPNGSTLGWSIVREGDTSVLGAMPGIRAMRGGL